MPTTFLEPLFSNHYSRTTFLEQLQKQKSGCRLNCRISRSKHILPFSDCWVQYIRTGQKWTKRITLKWYQTIVTRTIVPRNWSKLMKLMVTTLSLKRTILLSKIMGKGDANLKITIIPFLPLIVLRLKSRNQGRAGSNKLSLSEATNTVPVICNLISWFVCSIKNM